MTGTASLLEDLFAECNAVGIRLLPAGDGGLTIDAPRGPLTRDLLARLQARLQANKRALLSRLQSPTGIRSVVSMNAAVLWQSALDELEGDSLFPSDRIAELRSGEIRWESEEPFRESQNDVESEDIGPDGWPENYIAASGPSPCPQCDRLELWQSLAGCWHCLWCDPPVIARRIRAIAERLRSCSSVSELDSHRQP